MANLKNEAKIVFDELMYIYKNYYSSGMISQCKYPKYDEKNKKFGNEKFRISRKNYLKDFIKIGENGMFFLEFYDESLVSISYEFDGNGQIVRFELSFIPSFESPLFKNHDEHSILSKYIRIDFDNEGYKKITHPKIHLHNNLERDGLRIPLNTIIYPSEFVYLILRYYYDYDWVNLYKRLSGFTKGKEMLDDEEKKLFYLSINNG